MSIILSILSDKYVLAGIALMVAVGAANYQGHVSERRQCNAEAQLAKDALQAQFDEKSRQYEADKAKRENTMIDIRRRLANEKAKNTAYSSCHAGSEFVLLYKQVATGNAR